MKISDFFSLATRALSTKRSRTFLTILGMGVGIGAVLFLVSLGYGLQKVLIEEITTKKSFVTMDVSPGDSDFLKLTDKNIKEIQKIPGVKRISPVKVLPANITFNNLTGETSAIAVNSSYFEMTGLDESVTKGKIFKNQEINKVLVSDKMRQLFGVKVEDVIGKTVKAEIFIQNPNDKNDIKRIEADFEVVGILGKYNENVIFINRNFFQDYDLGNFTLLKVETKDSKSLKSVRQAILNKGFAVSAISDIVDQANKIFKAITVILAFFGIIALVVSAIGMFNTMTITLLERTQEIGVMKAIGASRKDIAGLFLAEATIMGFLGSVVGIVIGILGGKIFNFGLNLLAKNLGGEVIDIFYSPKWFLIFIVFFGSVIGFLTGIFPARRAGKLDPIEALKYK